VNGSGGLTYPLAPDFMGGSYTIGISSAWYGAHYSSVLNNLIETSPIYTDPVPIAPNALPCQAEHFNTVAGLINATPAVKAPYAGVGNTSFTLNFAAANIIIVNGGSGHAVGDSLNFNLKVGAVDSNGAITSVAQNGTAVVNTYDAYATPLRPFSLDGGSATCDTTVGDGSALSFLPTFAPISVPLATGLKSTYGYAKMFPATAFFAWNGSTTGGADPLGEYIESLGAAVQDTLPDDYGASLLNKYGGYVDGVYTTQDGTSTDYLEGFTPVLATQCATYRWLTISDAKTIYGNFSLPFILNAHYAPMSFHVIESSQDVTQIYVPDAVIAQLLTPAQTDPADFADWNGSAAWGTEHLVIMASNGAQILIDNQIIGLYGSTTPYSGYQPGNLWGTSSGLNEYQGIPANAITTYDPSNLTAALLYVHGYSIKAADFVNAAAGSWLCDGAGNLSATPFIKSWAAGHRYHSIFTDTVEITGSFSTNAAASVWTWKQTRHTQKFLSRDNWGVLNPTILGTTNSPLTAMTYLVDGIPSQLIAALPQNYLYQDPAFNQDRMEAADISAPGSTPFVPAQITPYLVDNTVESSQSEITVTSSDCTVTTELANARLFQITVDGQVFPQDQNDGF